MANQVAANPWALDTVGTIYAPDIHIKTVHWLTPTATGDEFILEDIDGNVIVHGVAEANGQSQMFRLGGRYHGLVLDTLDSGTVFVHFC